MRDERVHDLLAYFDRLINAEEHAYNCKREISEVIDAIRFLLDLKGEKK
jgi:hypothetical protein